MASRKINVRICVEAMRSGTWQTRGTVNLDFDVMPNKAIPVVEVHKLIDSAIEELFVNEAEAKAAEDAKAAEA